MNDITSELQRTFGGNQVYLVLALIASAFLLALIFKFIFNIVANSFRRITRRTSSQWDDAVVDLIEKVRVHVLVVVFFFLLTRPLGLKDWVAKIILVVTVFAVVYQLAVWGLHLIATWKSNVLDRKISGDPSSAAAIGLLYTTMQAGFLILLVLIGLSNLGVDITALVTGLGVGGIAVALAAQNVLGDLLASLSIVLDKPFVVGDYIVTGTEKGTVEQIGIKTTRLRSISGEQLVVSNKDLLESRVQNFKRLTERRMRQAIGVTYSTPPDVLEKIPVWIREIAAKYEKVRFDRCHFFSYGPSSLDFEIVAFIKDPEYMVFMDIQQQLLVDIYKKFAQEKVEFAFPTQTVYIEKLGSRDQTQS